MLTLLKSVFPSKNDRAVKRLASQISIINELEPTYQALTDDELKAKTTEFKQNYQAGMTLDELLPDAFACVREATQRVMGLRLYDVQLIGGIALHKGYIAEMATGEGKTNTCTLPAYLNALSGLGVHVVTVNSYLAKRDSEWMGAIYQFLGLTTGVLLPNSDHDDREQAYQSDITYGTNNEFGFDYLRDHMASSLEEMVQITSFGKSEQQKSHAYAIIDEVDSILIDDARTPLIISGVAEGTTEIYKGVDSVVKQLLPTEDFTINEKEKRAYLTDQGHHKVEEMLRAANILKDGGDLFDPLNLDLLYYCNAALKARFVLQKDIDYIVRNNQVVIIDENTGRAMDGRRWSDGFHQAVEAKENVQIQKENQTMASITLQNYFLQYKKLAGMTGTAATEAAEFAEIYGLSVISIPTNKPMIRIDKPDSIYLTETAKFAAIVNTIKNCYERGQPVLVGTTSIDSSERLSKELKKDKVPHQVLNAKFHQKEALIIAQAGCLKSVTIATNMAGRGTDIVLGGNYEAYVNESDKPLSEEEKSALKVRFKQEHQQVIDLGGLYVIGSERHDSRRIDNQLRGRSGRQGDPGASQFFISLDDPLMRIFASDKTQNIMRFAGMKESDNLEHSLLNRSVENAQKKMEGHHFDIRKQLLKFDNIANEQRMMIYQQREELMSHEDISDVIESMLMKTSQRSLAKSLTKGKDTLIEDCLAADKDLLERQLQQIKSQYHVETDSQVWVKDKYTIEQAQAFIHQKMSDNFKKSIENVDLQIIRKLEKHIVLQTLDHCWREHLRTLDHLRQNIHLRGYAQKNPFDEYRREAMILFEEMLFHVQDLVSSQLCRLRLTEEPAPEEKKPEIHMLQNRSEATMAKPTAVRQGRNELCSCGSGKKFKHCCGN